MGEKAWISAEKIDFVRGVQTGDGGDFWSPVPNNSLSYTTSSKSKAH